MDAEERARLRALYDAATSGEWKHDNEGTITSDDARCRVVGETECRHVFSALETGVLGSNGWEPSRVAAFIVAARKAMPVLLDALEAAEREIAAWEKTAEFYDRMEAAMEVIAEPMVDPKNPDMEAQERINIARRALSEEKS